MKLMVCGSRSITDKDWVWSKIDEVVKMFSGAPVEIIEGDASGVDKLAGEWAKANNVPLVLYPADWENDGRAAPHIRNRKMVDDCNLSLILWDGMSAGTYEDLCYCDKSHKGYFLKVYNQDPVVASKIALAVSKKKGMLKPGASNLTKLHIDAGL